MLGRAYDPQTRSELQTSQPLPSKNNRRDKLIVNADGSVDLYFGPKAPAGKEANWIASVPKKGWFAIPRLYGSLEPWFDKTWRPKRDRAGDPTHTTILDVLRGVGQRQIAVSGALARAKSRLGTSAYDRFC